MQVLNGELKLDSFEDASKEVFTHAQMIKNRIVPHARVEVLHGKLPRVKKKMRSWNRLETV